MGMEITWAEWGIFDTLQSLQTAELCRNPLKIEMDQSHSFLLFVNIENYSVGTYLLATSVNTIQLYTSCVRVLFCLIACENSTSTINMY